MRRIGLAVVAVILMSILLCGCTDGLSGLRIDQITKIEVIDLFSGNRIEVNQDDPKFETISPLIAKCQESFVRGGDCQPEDGHQYQLVIYTGDKAAVNVTINADGSFCVGRAHYLPTADSEGLALYIIRRAMVVLRNPYLLDKPEQISPPVELVQNEGWTYLYQQIMLEGIQYTVLARENTTQYQVVREIREPYGDRVVNTIEYVEDSLTASHDSMLYFSMYNADTGSSRVLGFSVLTDTIVWLPEDPCSNLLIIENGKGSYSGWLVCGDAILSVDLASGEIIEGSACTVSDLGGLPEIDGALFHDPQNVTAIRYVALAQGSEAGTIVVQVWQRENDGAPKMLQEYIYDLAGMELAA